MDPVEQVRRCALALPEASERLSHGSPSWFVRERRSFVSLADHHHGDPHLAIWAAAPPGVAADMVAAEPARFFVPPYVGHRGWIGVRLDLDGDDAVDGDEIDAIVTEAYRHVAPTTLVARLRSGT